MTIQQAIMQKSIQAILPRINFASGKSIDRLYQLLLWINRKNPESVTTINAIKEAIDQDKPMGVLFKRIFREMNPAIRNKFILDFVMNNSFGPNASKREKFKDEEGFYPPFTILLSPSMRCNLGCKGCYAAEYSKKDDLPFEITQRVIEEARNDGIYFFTILGGEPFHCEYMWDIYEKNNDVAFQVFTNGTLINKDTIERIIKLGNVAPIISLEGSEEETDLRRGKGVYQKTMEALDLLHEANALYGFSVMVTRDNVNTICGDEFNELMVKKGCYLGWHFLYMPVGGGTDVNKMPTPHQREFMRVNGAARVRNKYPLFVADFWNDAPYVGGCIAAGRNYIHINTHGDVEPCIFTHFAVDNIKERSLREVLKSPFFKAIRERQPFDENLLLPCQLIDNPQFFREIYHTYHPYPTHPGAESLVTELTDDLDRYSVEVKTIMKKAWEKDFINKEFKYSGKYFNEKESQ